jgi:5-(carboxyamino)imidazole ribonucleotide synthase
MFTMRAQTMGYRVVVLDPAAPSPTGSVADHHLQAAYDDVAALDEMGRLCAAVTTEFENVPAQSLARLAQSCVVTPPGAAVSIAQDRITEKEFLRDAGFATAPFRPVRTIQEAETAAAQLAGPALLKTSRLGYDGKGQAAVNGPVEAREAFERFGQVPCILEQRLELELELSVVLARGRSGALVSFPPAENRHRNGILDTSVVPARVAHSLANAARELAGQVARAMEYVGVLGVELLVAVGVQLYVNEMAPRPHNSGHYTIDTCIPDQFELQVRTLCDLPLVPPQLMSPVAMANLLGDLWANGQPRWDAALSHPGVRLHLYGKAEARPGRKMGHLNCLAASPDEALQLALEVRSDLPR